MGNPKDVHATDKTPRDFARYRTWKTTAHPHRKGPSKTTSRKPPKEEITSPCTPKGAGAHGEFTYNDKYKLVASRVNPIKSKIAI